MMLNWILEDTWIKKNKKFKLKLMKLKNNQMIMELIKKIQNWYTNSKEVWKTPECRVINGYEFVLTCSACPEQYDVYKNGEYVAYVRLRYGMLTVTPTKNGEIDWDAENIYEKQWHDRWLGNFPEKERKPLMYNIAKTIDERLKNR